MEDLELERRVWERVADRENHSREEDIDALLRQARQIAEEAEETGTHLDEKPVTLAIDEVAEGRINASQMDLTIEEENVPEEAGYGRLLH